MSLMSHSYFAGETVNCCQHIRDLKAIGNSLYCNRKFAKIQDFQEVDARIKRGGGQTHYLPKFAENCMKMKKGGGGRSFLR